jgi:hypothetical protein
MKVQKFIEKYMGRQVTFTYKLVKDYLRDEHNHLVQFWKPMPLDDRFEQGVGWVVGLRWLPRGRTIDYGWEDGGRQFRAEGAATLAFMVVTYPTRNPIPVPPDAVEVLDEPVEVRLWTKRQRHEFGEDAKEWPRDENGRWLKA